MCAVCIVRQKEGRMTDTSTKKAINLETQCTVIFNGIEKCLKIHQLCCLPADNETVGLESETNLCI